MKFRNTILFGIILLLLIGYVYFFEVKKAREEVKKEEEAKQVFLLDWDQVAELRIHKGEKTIVCKMEREEGARPGHEGKWTIVEPIAVEADQATIRGMVSTLKGLKIERVVDDAPADPSPYGLKDPQQSLVVKLSEETESHALSIGKVNPIGNTLYVQKEGEERILLVKAGIEGHVEKDLFDFREKRFLKFIRNDVDRISLKKNSSEIVLEKGEGGEWKLITPHSFRAAKNEVDKVFSKLANLKAQAFEDEPSEDLSVYGFDRPQVKLVLREGGETKELLVGKEIRGEGQVWARSIPGGPIVRLSTTVLENLEINTADLREKKVFRMSRFQVGTLKIRRGEEELVVEKVQTEWQVVRPREGKANKTIVDNILIAATGLKMEEFAEQGSPGDYGIDESSTVITLITHDKEKEDSLTLGKEVEVEDQGEKRIWVQSSSLEVIGQVDGAFPEKIPENFQYVFSEEAEYEAVKTPMQQ